MLNLQVLAKQKEQARNLIITNRLPYFILSPCILDVSYYVESKYDYYLIHLNVTGSINITCQRCIHDFSFPYSNNTTIGVCSNEERAGTLLEHYESIVSSKAEVNLEELIIDELHLYAPQFHINNEDCDHSVKQILNN